MKWWHRFLQRFRRKKVLKSIVHHAHPVRIPLNPSPSKPKKVAVYHDSSKSRANQTTGERHKNPLNVKAPSQPYWKGQVARDCRGHAVFDDVAFGTRAAIITLRTYWITHNLRTVAKIISRWAPSTDTIGSIAGAARNDPGDYARYVARKAKIQPTTALALFSESGSIEDVAMLYELISAMAKYENHTGYSLDYSDFERAITLL